MHLGGGVVGFGGTRRNLITRGTKQTVSVSDDDIIFAYVTPCMYHDINSYPVSLKVAWLPLHGHNYA